MGDKGRKRRKEYETINKRSEMKCEDGRRKEEVAEKTRKDEAEVWDVMAKAWFMPNERPSKGNKLPPTSTQTPQGSADMN